MAKKGLLDWLLPSKKASEITKPGEVSAQAAALNIKYNRYLQACSLVGVTQPFTMDQWVSAGKPVDPKAVAAAHGIKSSY